MYFLMIVFFFVNFSTQNTQWMIQYISFHISVIEEANWVTLYDDLEDIVGNGFDAVICLGNSFAHLLDNYGDQREQK